MFRIDPKKREIPLLLFSLVWCGMIVLMATSIGGVVDAEGDAIEAATVLAQGADLEGASVGDEVAIEAQVKADNPPLIHDLVFACREVYEESGESDSWVTRGHYSKPLTLVFDGVEVVVELGKSCPRGDIETVEDEDDDEQRWVGIEAEDRLTVVGAVTSTDPPRLKASHYYTGSLDEMKSNLSTDIWITVVVVTVCFLIGVALFLVSLGVRFRR